MAGRPRPLGDDMKAYQLGRSVFLRDAHCGTCHQPNGLGLPAMYPSLAKSEWLKEDERLIKIVLKGMWGPIESGGQRFDPGKGVPPMPGFGAFLTDEEVAGVIRYVRQSFGNDLPGVTPAQVATIRGQTKDRVDFYMIEEIMAEHPLPGWEKWGKMAKSAKSIYE